MAPWLLLTESPYGRACLVAELRRPMRWHNPELDDFERREVPKSEEEPLSLIDGYPSCEPYAEVYKVWRELGAGVMAALIRAGDVAREQANK